MKQLPASFLDGILKVFRPSLDVEAGLRAFEREKYEKAIKILRPHALDGNADAQYALGAMYTDGLGVLQDVPEALHWNKAAAEQGYREAQFLLGMIYTTTLERYEGFPTDHAVGAKWFLRAAQQGHDLAIHNLATAYANGDGVEQNYPEAVMWYRKAAEFPAGGGDIAQSALGDMYAKGKGVPQDNVEAYKWYYLAAIWDDDAAKDREEIAERMSFADIKKAQHLADEWLDQCREEGTQTHPTKRPLITY